MKRIYAFIRHNYLLFVSIAASVLMVLYAYSCDSTVISLVNPEIKINRVELVAEVDYMLAKYEAKFSKLDRDDLVKHTIFNSVLDLLSGNQVNPIGVVTTLLGILGMGAIGDNIRKRTHINTLKGSLSDGNNPKVLK